MMKHKYGKTATVLLAVLMLLSAVLLASCAASSEYTEYHTEENSIGKVSVEGQEFYGYFFEIEEGGAVLELNKDSADGRLLQTIEFPQESEYYASLDFDFAFSNVKYQDMNFDGNDDLYVPCSVTTANLEGMAWLWDSDEGRFVLSEELSALYELKVDSENKLIISTDYSDPAFPVSQEFQWSDGKLEPTGEYNVTE